jgi:hypothetical protein
MEGLRKRTRLVYFRVSELELEKFRDLCGRAGASSLSELARSAMQRMLDEHSTEARPLDLRTLYERVAALDNKLQELVAYLHQREPVPQPEQSEKERHWLAAE